MLCWTKSTQSEEWCYIGRLSKINPFAHYPILSQCIEDKASQERGASLPGIKINEVIRLRPGTMNNHYLFVIQ